MPTSIYYYPSTIQNLYWISTTATTATYYPIFVNQMTSTSSLPPPIQWSNIIYNDIPPLQITQPTFVARRRRPEPRIRPPSNDENMRARQLLLEHLDEKQREDFERQRFFIVVAISRRRYRIDCTHLVGNVTRLDDNARLCAHPNLRHELPHFDHILAQKLSLEYDEETFLAIANRH